MNTPQKLAVAVVVLLLLVAGLLGGMLRYRSAYRATVREDKRLREKLVDFPETRSYESANAALQNPVPGKPRVVFLGDSITRRWDLSHAMLPWEAVNRGIGRQTTSEMLVRLRGDVLQLNPSAVVILGGTNDFSPDFGPVSLQVAINNVESMVELARVHNVSVVVGTIPPLCRERIANRDGLENQLRLTASFNDWLRQYCPLAGCQVADFDRELQALSVCEHMADAIHPNQDGYEVMERLVREALQSAVPPSH